MSPNSRVVSAVVSRCVDCFCRDLICCSLTSPPTTSTPKAFYGWNAFFSLDVGKTDAIKISDRKNRKWIGTGDIRRWGYDAADAQFLGGAYLSGGTAGGTGPNGSVFDDRNVDDDNPAFLVALPGCAGLTTIPGQTDATAQAQGCLWNPAQQYRDLSPEEKYVNVFGRASFAFGEGGEVYTEIGYSKKETTFSNTPSGVSGSWGYPEGPRNASSGPGAVVLSPTHPDNPIQGQASRLMPKSLLRNVA